MPDTPPVADSVADRPPLTMHSALDLWSGVAADKEAHWKACQGGCTRYTPVCAYGQYLADVERAAWRALDRARHAEVRP